MINYQNDIMELLKGDTPKQKYDYLKELINAASKATEAYNQGVRDAAENAGNFTIHFAQPLTKITGAIDKQPILKLLKP